MRLTHAKWFFAVHMVEHFNTLQCILIDVEREQRGREVIVVYDQSGLGALPIQWGAPGLKPAGIIGIGIIPVLMTGKDVPSFSLAMKPDPTGQSTKKFQDLTKYCGRIMLMRRKNFSVI
jgi:hypothetical protein